LARQLVLGTAGETDTCGKLRRANEKSSSLSLQPPPRYNVPVAGSGPIHRALEEIRPDESDHYEQQPEGHPTTQGEVAMKVGARNQLIGEVVEIKRGAVMGEVKLTIPASSPMASVMTLESIDDMGIKKGDKVRVIVKAVSVLLIKE
jgi:molybdopterin-binding protein